MVEARDQVLITRFGTPGRFISSIRRSNFGSTNGPFFSDLDIAYSSITPGRAPVP
jgi:hypothetical protein